MMRSSDVDSFAALQAVLAGTAHPPVGDGDFKMLKFMLASPNGQDAFIFSERFDTMSVYGVLAHRAPTS
jgi:hypothetical protein